MRQQPIQFVGGAFADENRPWSMQDTCNYLPVTAERAGTRSDAMLKTPPGLRPYLEVPGTGAVRGLHNAEGRLFTVMGRVMYRVTNDGVAVPLGTMPGVGRVQMDHNQISLGNQVLAVNGQAGYIYNTVTDTFERVTDDGFPGGNVVKFIDGYFVVIDPQGRFAQNSAPADGTDWNTLDRFTSEAKPDRLVALAAPGNELMLLSSESFEFFQNTGASEQPFRSRRIVGDKGCAGPYVVAEADNTVFWLGSEGSFYQLEGYAARRISTRPIEQAIRGLNWAQAYAEVWEDGGHTVIYWTFPDGRTWGWDTSQQEWHRRESYGLNRWRVNCMTRWNDRWIAGDFQKKRLWVVDWDYPWEGSTEFESYRTMAVMHDNQAILNHDGLEVVMDTGQPYVEPDDFPPQPDLIQLWGAHIDGITLDPSQDYNSELAGASTVEIVGYWPDAYAYTYPPAIDPLPVDPDDYGTFVDLTGSEVALTLDTYWEIAWQNDLPDGQFLALISVDGTPFISAIDNYQAS